MFQNVEKENLVVSIDWKPLKWNRSGSLSSKGSGFSHSSSSKSVGAYSNETLVEVQLKNVMSVQSPSGDDAACVASTAPALSEESNLRKKPRLGWGEGLAKYEKKKVDCPEDIRVLELHVYQILSPPATPSSVACSSSPGTLLNKNKFRKLISYRIGCASVGGVGLELLEGGWLWPRKSVRVFVAGDLPATAQSVLNGFML
ncbi:unnamed protein product [Fraxinus pennsylvanica]|uniref:Uncharacterized protein n=1 Tax=Fraxinus pennsylvanica TaxID=56036 RepID=A0AAD2A7J8_9LAMI|nr:unnamed protein product [Fraxinus pennsylvanica]